MEHQLSNDMACLTPFYVMNSTNTGKVPVPCGKCPECRKRRVSGWSFRLLQESRQAVSALFITLTYNTEVVPITNNGFMNLSKRDVQLFMKRLRKISTEKLKYYLCGEYGGRTNRPHYHVIMFNAKIADIEATWRNGSIHYGQVSEASVGYTLKYMCKVSRIPMHKNDDRQPEFALMSKGMGANYITQEMIDYHKSDLLNNVTCVLKDGKKISMPRYYKDKIYTETERKRIAHFGKITAQIFELECQENGLKKYGDTWSKIKAEQDIHAFRKMQTAASGRDKL